MYISITKQEDIELSVPSEWREVLKGLGDFFAINEPLLQGTKISVAPIDAETIKINRGNIENYPDAIGPQTDKTWNTSICTWTGSDWAILLDLITAKGETSDLVLHCKIREAGNQYIIYAGLVFVP